MTGVQTCALPIWRANPVYEPPTRRILERCLTEERQHVADAASVLGALVTRDTDRARAARWEEELQALLREAGGVAGGAQ